MHRYTDAEDEILRLYYGKIYTSEIQARFMPDRSIGGIRKRVKRIGLTSSIKNDVHIDCANEVKLCKRCDTVKPFADFPKNPKIKCGFASWCQDCERKRGLDRYHNDPRIKLSKVRSEQRAKDSIFEAYGGYICQCCGETEKMFLTIDHTDGGGAEHRKEIGHSRLYRWLRKNNYPDGFRVLCINCNWGKYQNGGTCPHQEEVVRNIS